VTEQGDRKIEERSKTCLRADTHRQMLRLRGHFEREWRGADAPGKKSGRWALAAGRWPLAAGRWPLGAGRWALGISSV